MLAQKNSAWVAHTLEAFFGHGEHANFIDCTKTVFDGAHQSISGMCVAFKVQHGVHHVFEHARACECAFFGDMPHQHDCSAGRFGHAREVRCAFTHLRHRTRCTGELVGIHGLNRVHHHHCGLQFVDGGQDFFELCFGQHLHLTVVEPQAARTQGHLRTRLFTGDIQGAHATALQAIHRLQQQG